MERFFAFEKCAVWTEYVFGNALIILSDCESLCFAESVALLSNFLIKKQ